MSSLPSFSSLSCLPGACSCRCDIFCRVIDNFGDAGVCWRLARQLSVEYGWRVCLWMDAPSVLSAIVPQSASKTVPQPTSQSGAVDVRLWPVGDEKMEAADVVIEAFACELPENYLKAMVERKAADAKNPSCWINLEYLSAEDWIEGCHGLPSLSLRRDLGLSLSLVKYFFFPGFTPASGGLLREADLPVRQREFRREALLSALGLALPPNAFLTSLFCYDNAPVAALLDAWEQSLAPPSLRHIVCLVAPGQPLEAVRACLGEARERSGWQRGRVCLKPIPFLPQETYDALLAVCDFNFVRGEDSFVRAQWAGKPFVWQAYPQAENAHHAKLAAFAKRYRPHPALAALWRYWNGVEQDDEAHRHFWTELLNDRAVEEALTEQARAWRDDLSGQEDLAARLVRFCRERAHEVAGRQPLP